MPGISVSKIPIPFRGAGGISWQTYWATLISATVENAAPTHVVLTFPTAQTSLGATDFTIAGFTISSASWTGAVLTLVLSEAVLVFDGSLTITFITTGQTATVTNNVADDGNTVAWFDSQDLTTITKDESDKVSLWKDKLLQVSDEGADYVLFGDNETQKTTVSVSRCTSAQSDEQAHGGTYSSKVVHNALVGLHYLSINVIASRTYNVSVWVYIPSGQATIDTITLGSGGAGNFASTNTKNTWVQLTAECTPGSASISLSSGSSNSPDEYWYFDDFTIKEVDVAHDLEQATADYQPVWSEEGITFDGTDDRIATRPIELKQPSTLYAVVKMETVKELAYFFDAIWRTSLNLYPILTNSKYYLRTPSVGVTGHPTYIEGYDYFVIRLQLNAGSSYYRINDYAKQEGAMTANLDGLILGCKYNLGNFGNVSVREIIIRDAADSDEVSDAIYNSLINKNSSSVDLYGAFEKYAGNPILKPTAPSDYAAFASTLKVGDTYYMYYHKETTVNRATSSDGLTWVDDTVNNPILSPGVNPDWDYAAVGVPMVWYEGTTWYMLYRGQGNTQGNDAVGLATSSDGITWTKSLSNPVIVGVEGEWDEAGAEHWGIIKVGDTYYTYYEAGAGTARQIGVATSTDLVNWTKDAANNPIFTGGRFCPFAFKYGDYYYLLVPHYVFVSNYSEIEIYRDSEPTFYPASREYLGTVKKCSASGWDSADQDTPCILTDTIFRDTFDAAGGKLWLYYSGDAGSDVWSEGLLISDGL